MDGTQTVIPYSKPENYPLSRLNSVVVHENADLKIDSDTALIIPHHYYLTDTKSSIFELPELSIGLQKFNVNEFVFKHSQANDLDMTDDVHEAYLIQSEYRNFLIFSPTYREERIESGYSTQRADNDLLELVRKSMFYNTHSNNINQMVIGTSDDTPTGQLSLNQLTVITASEDNLNVTVSLSVAGAFNFTPGAVGVWSIHYSLQINQSNTGLVDSLSGQAIILSQNANVIEAFAAGQLVFTLSLDSAANLDFTLLRAIEHPNASDSQEIYHFPANLIYVLATITDSDGNSSMVSFDLQNSIRIQDSGPAIDVDGSVLSSINVDEANLGVTDTLALANAFTFYDNADGVNTDYHFEVMGGSGVYSGLMDSLSGLPVLLRMNPQGDLEGYFGNTTVFNMSITSYGDLNVTFYRTVIHPDGNANNSISLTSNLIFAVATAIDNDGDSATAYLDLGNYLSILDTLPIINIDNNLLPSLLADEANMGNMQQVSLAPAVSFSGGDGELLNSMSYQLQVVNSNPGIFASINHEAIILSVVNAQIEGRTQNTNALVFNISIDNNGELQFIQYLAIEHSPGNADNIFTLPSNTIEVLISASDNDNDVITNRIDLSSVIIIKDEVPILVNGVNLSSITHEDALSYGNNEGGQVSVVNGSLNSAVNFGADGLDTYTFVVNFAALLNALNLTSRGVVLSYSVNGNLLTARAGVVDVFTLELNQGAVGNYRFTLLREVDHPLANGNDSESLTLSFGQIIEAWDGDNDSVNLNGVFSILIEDDIAVLNVAEENAFIYENAIGTDPAVVNGNLSSLVEFGGDSIGYFQMRNQGQLGSMPNVTVNNVAVTYQVNNNMLSAMIGASVIFTLEVEADGDYTFTLYQNIDHTVSGGWLDLDFSGAIRVYDGDNDPQNLSPNTFILNIADDPEFNANVSDSLYLTTSAGGVVDLDGYYGLSNLDSVEADILDLISALIAPGGLLAGGTTEDALALIISQQGVFYSQDIVKLSSEGYEMAFNGSENLSFEANLLNQLSLLGMSIDATHVMGNQILFSTVANGVLPGVGAFENQDLILASQGVDGRYTFSLFFDGSAQDLQDGIINDGLYTNLLVDINLDDVSFSSADGTFSNGSLYFTLSNLSDVDLRML